MVEARKQRMQKTTFRRKTRKILFKRKDVTVVYYRRKKFGKRRS